MKTVKALQPTAMRSFVAMVLLSALSVAHAASNVIDIQSPSDSSAKPATLNLEDHGKPQNGQSP
ncbi:hypothetical protein [Paraburkholderia youngii]|uniref:hypothetical protein n=1 Tax=Paraburkholderia youngii TaxID=2782701 RepID=UPI003D21E6CE